MDKFKTGQMVMCVNPASDGSPGYLGRPGIVQGPRDWHLIDTSNGPRLAFVYQVLFAGDRFPMSAREEELIAVRDGEKRRSTPREVEVA